jgi:hypothetical protein
MSRPLPGDARQGWPFYEGTIKGGARGKACPDLGAT